MQKPTKKSLPKKSLFSKFVFYLYLGFVLYGTLMPSSNLSSSFLSEFKFEGIDKLVHAILFIGIAISLYFAYKLSNIWILSIGSFIGLMIEVLQGAMKLGRSFDLWDWVFDIIGIAIGLVIIYIIKRVNTLKINE